MARVRRINEKLEIIRMFYSVAEMFSISITNSVCICICIDFTPLVKYVHVKKHKENLRERVGWWIAAILPRAITFAPCVIKIRKSSKISNMRSLVSRNNVRAILFKKTRSPARGRRTIVNNTTIAIVRVIFKFPRLRGNACNCIHAVPKSKIFLFIPFSSEFLG